MDTASFIVKRNDLRARMQTERMHVDSRSDGKPAIWMSLLSMGMKWGLLPMAQEWAITSAGRWIYDAFHRSKSRR